MLRLNASIVSTGLALVTAFAALPAQGLAAAQATADFDILRSAIEEAHGGLCRYATKSELDGRFDAYRARLAALTNA